MTAAALMRETQLFPGLCYINGVFSLMRTQRWGSDNMRDSTNQLVTSGKMSKTTSNVLSVNPALTFYITPTHVQLVRPYNNIVAHPVQPTSRTRRCRRVTFGHDRKQLSERRLQNVTKQLSSSWLLDNHYSALC